MRETVTRCVAVVGHDRTFRRRLPDELGGKWFPASLEGGAKFLRRDLRRADPMLARFAAAYVRRGQMVWDIGANVGFFTFAAAGLGARVLAVEADTWLAGNLRRAARKQRLPIEVLPAAVADEWGVTDFVVAKTARAASYIAVTGGSTVTGGVRELQQVPTLPLDALLSRFRVPDVVKIDIEGAEGAVLRGATRVLELRPTLLLEVSSENQAQVHGLLAPHGYRYRDAETGQPVPLPAYNTVAVPDGRETTLPG